MAIKFIDMTGKTEEEAIKKALDQLGLDRDDVSVEILERAKSGFFGFGASPAKVRVTYGLEEESAPVKAPEKKEVPASPEKKEAPKAPAKVEKSAEKAPEKAEKAEKADKPRRERKKTDKKKDAPKPAATVESAPLPVEELGEPCDDEKSRQIVAFLTGLLEHMDSSAEIRVYQSEKGRYKVILEGEKLGQLIGRRGETLDAIQQLTNYSVNKGNDKRVRVHVDAENYRLKREQSLQHLANKVAAKVTKYKRNVTLEPMNAYERHVIHTALQDVPGVTTYSMGTEPNRRVIVAYDRESK